MTFLKLFGLTLLLNLLRYFLFGYVEQFFIFEGLFGAMEESKEFFRTDFQTIDWVTSYIYNFVMWFTAVYVFHVVHRQLSGHLVVRSLKVFGLILVLFLSISAIYMNHYSHPREFYVWNMIDAVIMFSLMGLANGLIYPLFRIEPARNSPGP